MGREVPLDRHQRLRTMSAACRRRGISHWQWQRAIASGSNELFVYVPQDAVTAWRRHQGHTLFRGVPLPVVRFPGEFQCSCLHWQVPLTQKAGPRFITGASLADIASDGLTITGPFSAEAVAGGGGGSDFRCGGGEDAGQSLSLSAPKPLLVLVKALVRCDYCWHIGHGYTQYLLRIRDPVIVAGPLGPT
jgi:hypothetical protein